MWNFLKHIASKSKLLLSGILLILLPGAVISYMSLRSVSQKADNLHAKYSGTVRLVRDKLENEVVQQEANLRRRVIESSPLSGKDVELKRWLDTLKAENSVFKYLFLVNARYGIVTPSISYGWELKPASVPSIKLTALNHFNRAEKEEFISKDYSSAAITYKKALTQSQSSTEYAVLLSRIGRCCYKSQNYESGIDEYEKILSPEYEHSNIGNVPAWAVALNQLAEGYGFLKNETKRKKVLVDFYKRLLYQPWDLHDGSYRFYLESVSNEISNLGFARDIKSEYPDFLEKEKELLAEIAFVEQLRQYIQSNLKLHINNIKTGIKTQPQHFRLVYNNSEIEIGFFKLPASFQQYGLSLYGYAFNNQFILSELFSKSLNCVELGRDLYAGVLNENDSLLYSEYNSAASDYLVADKFSQVFSQWKIALFDYDGRTIEQLVGKEKFLNLILFAGIIIIMLTGILFMFKAVAHEAEVSRLKSEFVSNVSHELKTPLALIRMFGETLDSGIVADEKKLKEFYSIIRKESERLTHLINNVLDFSRIDTGAKKYNFERTDLVMVVKSSLDAYLFHIRDNGFKTERILPEEPIMVNIDRDAISQALLNLLSNAVKYSGDEKHIQVEVGKTLTSAFISVTDHGVGIEEKEMKKIFEKFYRVPGSQISGKGGSGLGLTLTKQIIEAHDGTIEVKSKYGKGSRFMLWIPLFSDR